MGGSWLRRGLILVVISVIVSACAGTAPAPQSNAPAAQSSGQQTQPQASGRSKALNMAVTGGVQAMSIAGIGSPVGGWVAMTEVHSDGLITSDVDTHKQIGRLAEKVPSVDDGSITVLPDGRMRVVFNLRKGVVWHDGEPFTAQDLVFSYQISGPDGIPHDGVPAPEQMSSVEAPDDYTFVIYYKQPYWLATALGPGAFWPLPRHILNDVYQQYVATKNVDTVLQHPYWTSGYVHLGPFRMTSFDPGQGFSFQAHDRYFLGRPKIDTIQVRIYGDQNTLLAAVYAGAVDVVPELALREATGIPLRDTWRTTGDGTVHILAGPLRRARPQFRPGVQMEPTVLDPRVRTALYHALDREELADAVGGGNRQLTAWAMLPASDPNYEAVRDSLRQFNYSPDRARAILRDVGWTPGGDHMLRHSSDGRPFRTALWGSPDADREIAAYAAYWRAIGVEVDEFTIGGAQARDPAARAQFPGWDLTAAEIIDEMKQPPAGPENRWSGNRTGYDNPQARTLVEALERSITPADQLRAMRAINDLVTSQMLTLFMFNNPTIVAARKGVKAFGDIAGGENYGLYGSYYRNAYLWDID
jgi:peptide/nickel transport system substrate-binding protein